MPVLREDWGEALGILAFLGAAMVDCKVAQHQSVHGSDWCKAERARDHEG